MIRLVDAHCHFDFPVFRDTRSEAWQRARQAGVERLVIPGVRQADWERVIRVAAECEDWWYCLGIHPWFVGEHDDGSLKALECRLRQLDPRCIALGECGLDRLHGDLERQLPWFEAQVDIAAALDMPLIIHSVRTHDEVAAVLRRKRPDIPVLVHGFSGSYEQGRALVDLGCFLGIGGVITHDRARKTRSAVSRLPVDHLVLETDAPDMPPAGVAKGGNEPANLRKILTSLAGLLGRGEEDLAAALRRNVGSLYRWPVD
ncbi:TatD family hydrolase [Marinobacter zhanjiangensis]|uniref:Deoxyribonuclease n=1 Tax=Marinobacter zhanjiangensis TaxID=578215 RepID=A0ABQ3AUV0_9GAMM|nr:TatD family hydrolase [Marinobacter zhanjiangensis]GGY68038.1 deoxyribonuclease [Marinobacter zhanjiangensis]